MAGLKFLIKGDDSPIRKTLEKLKKDVASNQKAAIQSTIAATETTKKKQKEVLDTINAQTKAIKERNAAEAKRPTLSNSAAEVAAYQKSKFGAPNMTGPLVAPRSQQDLINQFKQLDVEQTKLTANYKAGKISADTYAKTIDALSKKQAELRTAIQDYNKGQDAATAATNKANGATKTQIGLLERLNGKLKTFKEKKVGLVDVDQIARANKKIQETEQEITRLNNIGRIGFDELGNKIEGTAGKIDRLKRISAGYRLMADSSEDLKQITVFNAKAQQAADEATRLSNVGKKGFDEMGNKIKSSGSLLGTMWSGLKGVANILPGIGIAGLLAFAVEPIMNYLSKLDLFSEKISETVKRKKELAQAMLQGAQNAQGELTTLKLLYAQYQNNNLPLKKRKEAYEELQKLYPDYFGNLKFEQTAAGKTKASYDQLTTSILATARARAAADKMTQNSSRILDNETKTNELREERIKLEAKLREQEAKVPKRDNRQVGASGLGVTVTDNRAEQEFLKTRDKIREIDEQIRNHRTDTNILTQRNLDLEKQVTKEVEKGAKISGAVGGEVDKIPKAKKKAEKKIKDLTYQKETEELKIRLEREKQLYEDYERFKTIFGEEAAKLRFRGEINYLNRLYEEKDKLSKADLTGPELERLKEINDRIDQALEEKQDKEDAAYLEAFNAAKTQAQKLFEIEKEYQDRLTALGLSASEKQKAALKKVRDAKIAEVLTDELTASDAWVKLFNNLDDLTAGEIDKLVREIESKFSQLTVQFPGMDMHQVLENLKRAKDLLIKDNPFKQMGIAIKEIFREGAKEGQDSAKKIKASWDDLSKSTEASFAFVNNAVNSAEFLKNAIGEVGATALATLTTVGTVAVSVAAAIKTAERASVILAILQGILAVGQAIANILSFGKKAREAARKEVREFYEEAERGEREYQASLRERARQQARDHATNMAAIKAEQALLKGQQSDIKSDEASLMARLQGEQYVESTTYKKGNLFRKAKTVQNMGSLKGMSYEQIAELAAQGKLTEGALKLFNELTKLKNEGEDVEQALIDAAKAADELATGTTAENLSDRIIENLRNGKNGLQDVMSDYASIIQDALLSTFKSEVVDKEMEAFYKRMAERAKDGLTEEEIKDGEADYIATQKRIDEQRRATEAATGRSLSNPTDGSHNSLQGAYKTASQESINLLAGNTAGLRIATIETNRILSTHTPIMQQQLQIAMQGIQYQQQIAANTLRTADNTAALAQIRDDIKSLRQTVQSNNNSAQAAGFAP